MSPVYRARTTSYRERKCADTVGTVLVPWAGHFQCKKIYLKKIKYTQEILQTALGDCYGLKLANDDCIVEK